MMRLAHGEVWRCTTYQSDGKRCTNDASVWLYSDSGAQIGGVSCEACASAVIEEYREKMGWEWTAQPIEYCSPPAMIECQPKIS